MKLFRCEVSVDLYVAADDKDRAIEIAEDNFTEETEALYVHIEEVVAGHVPPRRWAGVVPWGDDDQSVSEILARMAAQKQAADLAEELERRQGKLPFPGLQA